MAGFMKALVYRGCNRFGLEERKKPSPGPNEILIELKAAGLCGSDLHIKDIHDERMSGDPSYRPVVAGHEPAGVVAAAGAGVTTFRAGDRAGVYHKIGCGHCRYCREGRPVFCDRGGALSGEFDGAFQDYIAVPADCCLPLPDAVSFSDAAVLMCAGGTAYSGLKKLSPVSGGWLAVFGCGPVGLSTIIFARHMNLRTIGIDISDYRLELALKCGVDAVINASSDTNEPGVYNLIHGLPVAASTTVKEIYHLTQGRGVDLAAECSAVPAARINVVDCLKNQGKAVFLGIDSSFHGSGYFQRSLEMDKVIFKELKLYGSNVFPKFYFDEMTDFMIRHNVSFRGMITHQFSLHDGEKAFAVAASGRSGKVMLLWEEYTDG
jgi:propanol-preferring alcohol dehydrogenase